MKLSLMLDKALPSDAGSDAASLSKMMTSLLLVSLDSLMKFGVSPIDFLHA
jgi:hypothetical protein